MYGYAKYRNIDERSFDLRRQAALLLLALLAVVLIFDLSTSGVLARVAAPDNSQIGWASQEFVLRESAKINSPRVRTVKPGEKLRVVDSNAGEVLDAKASTPAKWYLVTTTDGKDAGWAYSAWIRR